MTMNSDKRAELEAALNCQSANTSAEFDLSECFQYKNPFANLETEFLQTKYYKEYFGLVVRIYVNVFTVASSLYTATNVQLPSPFQYTTKPTLQHSHMTLRL